jgi:hypothetical protein
MREYMINFPVKYETRYSYLRSGDKCFIIQDYKDNDIFVISNCEEDVVKEFVEKIGLMCDMITK